LTGWGRWLTTDAPTGFKTCRRFRVPIELNPAFTGALGLLTDPENWEKFGDKSPGDMAALSFEVLNDEAVCMDTRIVGAIVAWPSDILPGNLVECDGSTLARVDYPELWEVWPSSHKSDTSLTLPDLRNRFIVGVDPETDWNTGGAPSVTLTPDQLPAHTHSIANGYGPGTTGGYLGEIPALVPAPTPETTTSAGGSQAHENRPPFMALRWCVVALP
jgi:microcystin-dependent protein